MGWASGTELAIELWDKIKKYIPEEHQQNVAWLIYDKFTDYDADAFDGDSDLERVAGVNLSFDDALKKINDEKIIHLDDELSGFTLVDTQYQIRRGSNGYYNRTYEHDNEGRFVQVYSLEDHEYGEDEFYWAKEAFEKEKKVKVYNIEESTK